MCQRQLNACKRRDIGLSKINGAALLLLNLLILNAALQSDSLPQLGRENFQPNYAVDFGAPLINPLQEDITLEKDSNYVLRCEANEEVVWKVPQAVSSFEVKPFLPLDDKRNNGMELSLADIDSYNVGNYYCIKLSSVKNKDLDNMDESEFNDLVNNYKASVIYIYVNDPENLLAPPMSPMVVANQYQDTTIPCKPTLPSVEVLLTAPNGETFSSEKTGRYDPQRGFVIVVRALTDGGSYICRPKIPSLENEEEQTEFLVHFVGNEHIDLATTATTTATTTKLFIRQQQPTKSSIATKLATKTSPTYHHKTKSTVTNTVNVTNPIVYPVTPTPGDGDYNETSNTINVNDVSDVGVDVGLGELPGADVSVTVAYAYDYDEELDDAEDEFAATAAGVGDPHDAAGGADDGDLLSIRHFRRRAVQTTPSHRSGYVHYISTPRMNTKYIKKPRISSNSTGHAYEGDTFKLLCEADIAHDVRLLDFAWHPPAGVDMSRINISSPVYVVNPTNNIGHLVLTVRNAKRSDSGNYKCSVTDQSSNRASTQYLMTILKKGEGYINMSEPLNYYVIKERANKTITMSVNYRGHPRPTIKWFHPDGSEILNTHNYKINITDSQASLVIQNAQMVKNTGRYTVVAKNGFATKELGFNVSISDKPIAMVEDVYVEKGQPARMTCRVSMYPPGLVTWVFTPCSISPRWPSCEQSHDQDFISTRSGRAGNSSIEYLHDLSFVPTKPGIMRCLVKNTEGVGIGKGHVLIGDIKENMTITGIDENQKIARGDEISMTCAALAYYFAADLSWYLEGQPVVNDDSIEINNTFTEFSYKSTLKFKSIEDRHRGTYECRARNALDDDQMENKYINIYVHEPAAPKMSSAYLDAEGHIERELGESLLLECKTEALPKAKVLWYKDDVQLINAENLIIDEEQSSLLLPFVKPDDEGDYKCVVTNRLGSIESQVKVKIINMPGLKLGWILGILFFLLVLIGLVIFLLIRWKREHRLLRELKAAGLANFEEGAVEHINPALSLDEQADLLPYDRCFEFPREKLKLGKQLGAGAFGVVLKGHAEGIRPDEKESVVAVKMVKRTADNEVMRALVSELKIMVHLGQHLNVVNLLGAVTKNIAKRELMVIVEYCRFGNVQNFLLRNRKRFINQISADTDKIDPTITVQRFSDNFELNRDGVKYTNLTFHDHQYINQMNNKNNVHNLYAQNQRRNSDNDPRSGTRAGRPNSAGYVRRSDAYEGQVDSCATENTVMTTVPGEDDNILSNNSVQPAWRSNYKTDSTEAMTITTSDLISWAFQVARGMDYLSSKKVLHGDLAARNILLCEDNVVKICDFGLARSMYKSDNYKKQGEARLPIKWLALESLSDQVFSTYTDVWSYGIVLWEFFSLAKVPYPGMDPNQSLYLKLKDGYRMEKPAFANDELYDIMLECWSTNPESRPLFNVLERRFAKMLGDDVTNHYLDLNEPYLRMNTEYMRRTQTDYLALMGSPDELAPPPPRYINGHILPEIRIEASSDDYLQMSTNTGTAIFSPTRPKEYDSTSSTAEPTASVITTSFTFPDAAEQHSPTLANNLDSPLNKHRLKDGVQPEEIPMLHNVQHNHSDGEQSPETKRTPKFTNLQQQGIRPIPTPTPRNYVAETPLTGDDNYVNVKSPQRTLNSNGARVTDAFSNPSYHILKTVNENDK